MHGSPEERFPTPPTIDEGVLDDCALGIMYRAISWEAGYAATAHPALQNTIIPIESQNEAYFVK